MIRKSEIIEIPEIPEILEFLEIPGISLSEIPQSSSGLTQWSVATVIKYLHYPQ